MLGRGELLQLIGGNPESTRPSYLHGFRADLPDAYAENIPEIDVTDDIVVMSAGTTCPTDDQTALAIGSLASMQA